MLSMIAGVMFIFSLFGVHPFSSIDSYVIIESELNNISSEITKQYGNASVQAVRLSQRLSDDIAVFMRQKGLSASELSQHPDLLESLLKELLPSLLTNLDATDCSGAFFVLDATVRADAISDNNSKAGLYVRNIEPNIRGMGTDTRYLLRGPSTLAGDGRLDLQSKWDLEFDISDQAFWHEPITAWEADMSLSLSRLVYWCSVSPIQGLIEDVMVCSLPIIIETGNIIGVCGFEISQMNFMLRHEPDIKEFYTEVFLFSSEGDYGIRLGDALFAGNSVIYSSFPKYGWIQSTGSAGNFTIYAMPDSTSYAGMSRRVKLSPDDSPFAGQTFTAMLLIPKGDFDAVQNAVRIRFGSIIFALTMIGILASIIFSRRYLNPFMSTLGAIRSGRLGGIKTNIVELDQLIEEVSNLRAKGGPLPEYFFADFARRTGTLSTVEKRILSFYIDGTSDTDIISALFITKQALRKHSVRIYEKLGVSSKEAFVLYIELIKMSGQTNRIV